jgi:hypothetical protein
VSDRLATVSESVRVGGDGPLERLAEQGLHARLLLLGFAPAFVEQAGELTLFLALAGRRGSSRIVGRLVRALQHGCDGWGDER